MIILALSARACFVQKFGQFLFPIIFRKGPFSDTDELSAIFIKFREIAENVPLFRETIFRTLIADGDAPIFVINLPLESLTFVQYNPECARIRGKIRKWGRRPECATIHPQSGYSGRPESARILRYRVGEIGGAPYGAEAAAYLGVITIATPEVAAFRRRCATCRCFFAIGGAFRILRRGIRRRIVSGLS